MRHDFLVEDGLHAIKDQNNNELPGEQAFRLVAIAEQGVLRSHHHGDEKYRRGQGELGFEIAEQATRIRLELWAVKHMKLYGGPVIERVIDERRHQAEQGDAGGDPHAWLQPEFAALPIGQHENNDSQSRCQKAEMNQQPQRGTDAGQDPPLETILLNGADQAAEHQGHQHLQSAFGIEDRTIKRQGRQEQGDHGRPQGVAVADQRRGHEVDGEGHHRGDDQRGDAQGQDMPAKDRGDQTRQPRKAGRDIGIAEIEISAGNDEMAFFPDHMADQGDIELPQHKDRTQDKGGADQAFIVAQKRLLRF